VRNQAKSNFKEELFVESDVQNTEMNSV